MNPREREELGRKLGAFMREYGRTGRRRGFDSNDRHYDRKVEERLKRLPPEELDELLRGETTE